MRASLRLWHIRSTVVAFAIIGASIHAMAQQPILSPRDSVEILFEGKKISVNYGKPSMRNRKIMGDLVPFGKVWRTGANEATAFVTEVDIEMGATRIHAGAYTLYTLPSATHWKLIINKQTGQWGTVYNHELDLIRLDLQKKTLRKPVEKLTFLLKKNGAKSGSLVIEWERTSLSIPFRVLQGDQHPTPPHQQM